MWVLKIYFLDEIKFTEIWVELMNSWITQLMQICMDLSLKISRKFKSFLIFTYYWSVVIGKNRSLWHDIELLKLYYIF